MLSGSTRQVQVQGQRGCFLIGRPKDDAAARSLRGGIREGCRCRWWALVWVVAVKISPTSVPDPTFLPENLRLSMESKSPPLRKIRDSC